MPILPIIAFIAVVTLSGCSAFPLERITAGFGAVNGAIGAQDIEASLLYARAEVSTAELTRLPAQYGNINLGLELLGITAYQPEFSYIVGLLPTLRYSYSLNELVSPYVEFGAGPILLAISTREQSKGFSFYDQVGAGIEYRINTGMSIIFGYRFGHISHGGTRNTVNRGIEIHTGLVGFVLDWP